MSCLAAASYRVVSHGIVLDLRYEARDIDQNLISQEKVDLWFGSKTKGLNGFARAQLKKKWGTMQKLLSSRSRLEKIVSDILLDMETQERLADGRGNAILVSGSIYQACKFYELFDQTDLSGKCAGHILQAVPSADSRRTERRGSYRKAPPI